MLVIILLTIGNAMPFLRTTSSATNGPSGLLEQYDNITRKSLRLMPVYNPAGVEERFLPHFTTSQIENQYTPNPEFTPPFVSDSTIDTKDVKTTHLISEDITTATEPITTTISTTEPITTTISTTEEVTTTSSTTEPITTTISTTEEVTTTSSTTEPITTTISTTEEVTTTEPVFSIPNFTVPTYAPHPPSLSTPSFNITLPNVEKETTLPQFYTPERPSSGLTTGQYVAPGFTFPTS